MADRKITNEPESGYQLAGAASSLKEYKFCYYLNQLLHCDFRKLRDISLESSDRTRQVQFSVFRAEKEADEIQFTVFLNKAMGEYLLSEVSNFDYVIRVDGKFTKASMNSLVEGIRRFPEVMMSSEIPIKKIKKRERLIYEEEKEPRKLFQQKKKLNA